MARPNFMNLTEGRKLNWRESLERMRPWFGPLLRELLLFLALVLMLISVDFPDASGALWWPLPLAFASALLTAWRGEGLRLRWKHLIGFAIIYFILLLRGMLGLHGPVPPQGLRDAQNLVLILIISGSLWYYAGRHPLRALAIWTLALTFGWLTTLFIVWRGPQFGPRLFATGISALAGGVLWLLLWRQEGLTLHWPRIRPLEELLTVRETGSGAPGRLHYWIAGLIALIAGGVTGSLVFLQQRMMALGLQIGLDHGLRAQEALWAQSVLFGWGVQPLRRLTGILASPNLIMHPPWGGIVGFLATYGTIGLLLVGMLAAILVKRLYVTDLGRRIPFQVGRAANFLVLFWIGVMVIGGPGVSTFEAVMGGWMALALVSTKRIRPFGSSVDAEPAPRTWVPHLPSVLMTACVLFLVILMALPAISNLMLNLSSEPRSGQGEFRRQLARAAALNPYNPEISLALAGSYRRAMTTTGFSQSNYLGAVGYYQRAMAIDPYATEITRGLASFQLASDRQEDAIATVQQALKRQPAAIDLSEWLFFVALRLKNWTLAYQMLDHSLRLDPTNSRWWWHLYALAQMLGQGPLAQQAYGIAMTGVPDHPELLRLSQEIERRNAAGEIWYPDESDFPVAESP